ncbi:putative transposase for IS2404 [Mycobacterium ulcerans str. Harvey]|uniref:Transposase for IS2404 n=1 Tax=Mycobacterium ulcerans str. Harvey TaxID=1299332 RepID=A0ABP3A7N3_MYCUL|nr:putative transposase for IS2404 [Mycobacterium ulcerans str. Harvey]
MHTQVVTAKLICATLKSHYLMIVKSNQAKILARITALPWAEVPQPLPTTPRHGRVETRTCKSSPLHEESLPLRKTNHPDHS